MRSRHQAITISSKTKKLIVKKLFIDNQTTQNEQNDCVKNFLLSKLPEVQESSSEAKIPPLIVVPQNLITAANSENKFKISSKAKMIAFPSEDYEIIQHNQKAHKINFQEIKDQINREQELNNVISSDDLTNVDENVIRETKECAQEFLDKMSENKNKLAKECPTLMNFFKFVKEEMGKCENNIKTCVSHMDRITAIQFQPEGNIVEFK